MQIKDLSVEDFILLIQETVAETVKSLLIDPDANQQLKPDVAQALIESLHQTQNGKRGVPVEEVAKRLGLNG